MSNDIYSKCSEQAARIAELEARYEHWFKEATKARGELATLCRKIDEAPVLQQTHVPVEGNTFHFRVVSLISKEDLQG